MINNLKGRELDDFIFTIPEVIFFDIEFNLSNFKEHCIFIFKTKPLKS